MKYNFNLAQVNIFVITTDKKHKNVYHNVDVHEYLVNSSCTHYMLLIINITSNNVYGYNRHMLSGKINYDEVKEFNINKKYLLIETFFKQNFITYNLII
jgi:hypothetical protein